MKLTRREFVAMGGKAAAGTAIFVACGIPDEELIIQSPVDMPEDLVRGEDTWFATSFPDGSNGDGIIVRIMQGRAKKVAGNPDHPVNLGKSNARYDSALQMLYHPDRLTSPLMRRTQAGTLTTTSWSRAEQIMNRALDRKQVTIVTNPMRGQLGWISRRFAEIKGGRHITFDPLEQGVLHKAIKTIFGADVLPDLDIQNAHTVLSFGADWLSTWISPARYSVQYGLFRGGDHRGYLIHAESRMSMTAANADTWLPCKPGTEGDIALAIANVIIDEGLASNSEINAYTRNMPPGILNAYRPRDVAARSNVPLDKILQTGRKFGSDRPSLAFAGGAAGAQVNGTFNVSAAYSLNTLVSSIGRKGGIQLNPEPPLEELIGTATGDSFESWEKELAQWRAGNVDTVIIRGADIVHGLPNSVNIVQALEKVPNVIVFGSVMDDTMGKATLALPETYFLEEWGTDVPEPSPGYQVVGFQQPVVGAIANKKEAGLVEGARGFGDELLRLSGGSLGASSMRELVNKTSGSLYATGRGSVKAPNATLFHKGVLQRGGWWDIASKPKTANYSVPNFIKGNVEPDFSETDGLGKGLDVHLVPFVSNSLLDGKFSPAPWAQQTPDPISSAAWTTWVEINKDDAKSIDVGEGDVLFIKTSSGEIEAIAYPHPGVPPGVIGIPLGGGKTTGGRWAENRGENVLKILVDKKDEVTGALAWGASKARIQKTGRRLKLAKFEGNVEAYPIEPGVPILVVAPGETASDAEESNHHRYLKEFKDDTSRAEVGLDRYGNRTRKTDTDKH